MTTDSNDTDPPEHIFWLFIVHLLRALGPEKGREALAGVTDLLEEAEVWPFVMKGLTDTLSEAYVYAAGLKNDREVTKSVIEGLKRSFAQEHVLDTITKADGIQDKDLVLSEVEKLKEEGYLPDDFGLIPVAVGPGALKEVLMEALRSKLDRDEFGATKGCGCPRCTAIRAQAKQNEEQGYDPAMN